MYTKAGPENASGGFGLEQLLQLEFTWDSGFSWISSNSELQVDFLKEARFPCVN